MKTIKPLFDFQARVRLPGSKSLTQRAMILAALAQGESVLVHPLLSEDTEHLLKALGLLGAEFEIRDGRMMVQGTGGKLLNPEREIFLGNNGTALRLLTTVVCLGRGDYILTGTQRLRERPVGPLLEALRCLGVRAGSLEREGYPPVVISASGLPGGEIVLGDLESSQFVSSLLIAAPLSEKGLSLRLTGPIPSRPYIDMTVALMNRFGVQVQQPEPDRYQVLSGQPYRGILCPIESDVSSASYFFLAAAIARGTVRVEPISEDTLQGDIGFLPVLEKTGASVTRGQDWVEVSGGPLIGGDMEFDFSDMPDMVPSLAVLAACRPGRTVIRNVAHLRIKESDRLQALARELNRVGVPTRETEDGLIIEGGVRAHGTVIETYNDHRMAMSFAVLGLVVDGIRIKGPDCVKKSFPGFWQEMEKLYRS